ncbi:unnamed protein product [Acanthoscelides obtectus]|nr:unnamed protein product [Acanthoscelides obtectus]CAK1677804.1 hypothetical protein AOBTE_LOCUS31565 [Acanthoscelides obtectus]
MGVCSLILTIILYSTETIYFRAATLNFYVVFPFILNVVTLGGLVYLPIRLKIWDVNVEDEENVTLRLNTKRKRAARKNN